MCRGRMVTKESHQRLENDLVLPWKQKEKIMMDVIEDVPAILGHAMVLVPTVDPLMVLY